MTVARRMSATPPVVSPDSDCLSALSIMRDAGVSALPVLEGEHLVGVVHDRDILLRVPLSRRDDASIASSFALLAIVRVAGVMNYQPLTVDDTTLVPEALRLMVASELTALPVLRAGRLVGVLTATNAVRAALEILRQQRPASTEEEEIPE
jgi:acetoin utilization protein AcuB